MAQAAVPLFVASSLMQASQRIHAGEIARGEAEVAARQEELGAIQRESDRKGRLASALASQTASAGAKGIAAFEGSPLTILQEDIKAEKRATERGEFRSRLSAMTQRSRGRVARTQARTQAFAGLLGDSGKIAGAL